MGNRETIYEALCKLGNQGICDDCLEENADVHPRQQVNQIVWRLVEEGLVTRKLGDCAIKYPGITHGSKGKFLNHASINADGRQLPKGSRVPAISEQTDVLSHWLFDAQQYLNRLENISKSHEYFAPRVDRLKREGKIGRALAAQMQLLNTYRVQVVKDRNPLDADDWALASQTMYKTRSEWKKSYRA